MRSTPPVPIGKIGKMGIANQRFSVGSLSPALWLDAADPLSIMATDGKVSQWSDKSGRGHHAVQTLASEQPVTGTRTLNGRNTLVFNGVNSNMDLDYSTLFSIPSGNNTIITVWATDTPTIQQRVLSGFVSGGTRWGVLYEMLTGVLCGINSSSYDLVYHSHTYNTNAHIDFMRRSGSTVEIGRDGDTNSTKGTKGVNVTVDNIRLGATLGATNAINGVVAEMLIFNRALSDQEMNRLGKYLSKKWGALWNSI